MAYSENTHTRGAVKDPEHDGRLKENRGVPAPTRAAATPAVRTPGAVKDPEHHGWLKENRDKGVHKSDA